MEPFSYYLSDESAAKRIRVLVKRIAAEHCGDGPFTYDSESDYQKLPDSLKLLVARELHK